MIDVGFNLLSWAVLKRKSIKYIDKSLQKGMAKTDPYGDLQINSPSDPLNGKWMAIDLARDMNMGDDRLFQQTSAAAEVINAIIRQRSDDGISIEGDVLIDDENTCLAELSIGIMSKRKALQMTVECQILDLIYPTREIHQMNVLFYSDDAEIFFNINPADINNESFFAALGDKEDCKTLVKGSRIFATGPDAWAEHLRELQGDNEDPWLELPLGGPEDEKRDLGFEIFDIPEFGSRTLFLAQFEGESYTIDFHAGDRAFWHLQSSWTSGFKFNVSWGYCDDYLLLKILQNDYRYYDYLHYGMEIKTLDGEELPSKHESSKSIDELSEPKKVDEEKLRKQAEKREWKKRRKEALRGVEDLTGDHAIELPIEHVHINDLIVRSSVRTCWNKDHEIREVIAVVCVFDRKKGVIEVAVEAFCCPQCKRYYILQKAFDRLRSKGAICCKIITKPGVQYDFMSQAAMGLSDQSIYNSLGYNVNAEEGLTPQERRAVLDFIIENGFRTQKQTIDFIEGRINYNGRKPNMENAVKKWESDIEYLIRNQGKMVERVRIDRIFLTEHTKWK